MKSLLFPNHQQYGQGDSFDYFQVKGTLVHIRKQNNLYKACPSGGCKKKVTEDGGKYRCEKCQKDYTTFEWRLMMSISFSDSTGQAWFSVFHVRHNRFYSIVFLVKLI